MEIKYKHLPTGKIITIGGKSGDSLLKIIGKLGDSNLLLGDIIKGSDWQEVVEKDYEILSLARFCSIKPTITDVSNYGDGYIEALLKCDNARIHSVKRLSDGEVFTIGDMTTGVSYNDSRSIESFIVQYDNSIEIKQKHGITKLKYLVKAKQPLFITEDGVNVFKGDIGKEEWNYFPTVNTKTWKLSSCSNNSRITNDRIENDYIKIFSTKEAAEKYLLMNKPCISINDLLSLDEFASNNRLQIYMSSLKELVKSKL